tara:strand:- start:1090 stop:1635 length:546 start_codon:yes stop_codon:yes gene_type:complete
MLDDLAKLFYDTDILTIRKDQMDLDFYKAFAQPKAIKLLSEMSSEIIDDYAIDSITCLDESLPYATHIAAILDLPIQWIHGERLIGGPKPGKTIKRTMFLSLATPNPNAMKELNSYFSQVELELVGVFNIIGVHDFPKDEPIQMINLVHLGQLLQIYRQLMIITEEEYNNLLTLQEVQDSE